MRQDPTLIDMHASPEVVNRPVGISPEVAIVATYSPKEVNNATFHAALAGLASEHAVVMAKIAAGDRDTIEPMVGPQVASYWSDTHREPSEEQLATIKAAEAVRAEAAQLSARSNRIHETRSRLGRGAALLAFLPGAIAGVSMVEGWLRGVDDIATSVHTDKSILPGQNARAAAGIPGVADVDGYTYKYRVTEAGTMVVETTVTTDRSADAKNAYSPDGELNGNEVEQDLVAARKLVNLVIDSEGTITKAVVTGRSSDERKLGADEPLNQKLSANRAGAGKEALATAMNENGLAPVTIEQKAQEIVLSESEIAQVEVMAANLGMTSDQLTAAYNKDRTKLPKDAVALLDDLLAENRGVSYELTVKTKEQKVEPTFTEKVKDAHVMGINGELIAGLLGMHFGFFTLMIGGDRLRNRLAHRRARRQMRTSLQG